MAKDFDGVRVLHIRFEGRSFDIPLADLDVGTMSNDGEIKRVLANYFGVAVRKLHDYVIDRHNTGNLTVRPHAVFG